MSELSLDSLAEPVRAFFESLPKGNGETVLVEGGRAVFRIQPANGSVDEWTDVKNARRFALIDREMDGTLSADEATELKALQTDFRRFRRRTTPLPIGETRQLLEELERKAGQSPP